MALPFSDLLTGYGVLQTSEEVFLSIFVETTKHRYGH